MPKTFTLKMPPNSLPRPNIPPGEYVVVTCPKCGKKTYGVAGQKGKKCPVCRRQFPMHVDRESPRFATPQEACRYIQAEETKRAGRMDFTPVPGGFRPAACAPVIARTSKVVAEAKSLDAQFATWVRQYFATLTGNCNTGVSTTTVIAAATKTGFMGADKLIEKAVEAGIIVNPRPYSVWLAKLKE